MAVFRQRLRDLTFEEGDAITLHCAIDSSSPYSTVWYKNEELLTEDSRAIQHLSDDGLATLTITNAKPYDADIYRCVVRSKAGRLSTSMKLLLGGLWLAYFSHIPAGICLAVLFINVCFLLN